MISVICNLNFTEFCYFNLIFYSYEYFMLTRDDIYLYYQHVKFDTDFIWSISLIILFRSFI